MYGTVGKRWYYDGGYACYGWYDGWHGRDGHKTLYLGNCWNRYDSSKLSLACLTCHLLLHFPLSWSGHPYKQRCVDSGQSFHTWNNQRLDEVNKKWFTTVGFPSCFHAATNWLMQPPVRRACPKCPAFILPPMNTQIMAMAGSKYLKYLAF